MHIYIRSGILSNEDTKASVKSFNKMKYLKAYLTKYLIGDVYYLGGGWVGRITCFVRPRKY